MSTWEQYEQEVPFFVADLLKEDDLGAVVRTHIRIEHALKVLVRAMIKDPSFYERMDLDYASTVLLAGALGISSEVIPSLNSLGTLRNKFAHDLSTQLDANAVQSLYESLSSNQKEDVQKLARELWLSHKPNEPFPGFKKLGPRDRFVTIAVQLWGGLNGALLLLQSNPDQPS